VLMPDATLTFHAALTRSVVRVVAGDHSLLREKRKGTRDHGEIGEQSAARRELPLA
jgi:hypothetical protein